MSDLYTLRQWIKDNRPDLAEKLPDSMLVKDAKAVLNEATGLNIGWHESIESSCKQYLAALKNI